MLSPPPRSANLRSGLCLLSVRTRSRSCCDETGLASGCEIACHFARLLQPRECVDALNHLIQIASFQRFSVPKRYFDVLLQVLAAARGRLRVSGDERIGKHLMEEEEVTTPQIDAETANAIAGRVLELLVRISVFPSSYFQQNVARRHLIELRKVLPDATVFRILGNFVSRSLRLATIVASTGFDDIISRIDVSDLPSFVEFVGSFGSFPELNHIVVPLFESHVLPGVLSGDSRLIMSSLTSLCTLATNSAESFEFVVGHHCVHEVFDEVYCDVLVARVLLCFSHKLIEMGKCSFAVLPSFESFLKRAFEFCDDECSELGFKIVFELVKDYSEFVCVSDFIELAFASLGREMSFGAKQCAMAALCARFVGATETERSKLLDRGLTDVIVMALECSIRPLRDVAGRALVGVLLHGESTGSANLVSLAREHCEQYDVDEGAIESFVRDQAPRRCN